MGGMDAKTDYLLSLMTEKQRRRWELYLHFHSIGAVAHIEGVNQKSIRQSIKSGLARAIKRTKKEKKLQQIT